MRDYLIDDVLPKHAVHLLAGSPGAGKTRLCFGMLDQFLHGHKFLDHKTHNIPYCFVSLDRHRASVEETLETMGLKSVITRLVCLDELPNRSFEAVAAAIKQKYPDTQFVIMEGFQLFVGDFGNRYKYVADFLVKASAWCVQNKMTIIGVCHSSKVKKGSEFVKGRDRIGGSVGWSAYSETIIIVDCDEQTKIRTVDLYPRNAAEETFQMIMGPGGVLLMCPKEKSEQIYVLVKARPEGSLLTRQEILEWAENMQMSYKTADRAIKRALDDGVLEEVEPGVFKRPYTA